MSSKKPKSSKKRKPFRKLPSRLDLLQHFAFDLEGNLVLRKSGKKVGWKDKRGYFHVNFRNVTYKLHRIVYKMWHGKDPGNKVIDHRDGNPSNNSITNLRCVTHRDNLKNKVKDRKEVGNPSPEPLPDLSGVCGWFGQNPDF